MFFAYNHVPGYRLVVAANRDEFHSRPTAPASRWADEPQLLAGRDLEAGGTWLGVTDDGRFSALTNCASGPRANYSRSRGALVTGFLSGNISSMDYLFGVHGDAKQYNGFNLLVDDGSELAIVSNRAGQPRALEPGIYGLSNEFLDTPWPKVVRGKNLFGRLLREGRPAAESLLGLMDDREEPNETDAVRGATPASGSPMFIDARTYGTRSISVLALDYEGVGWFAERRYDGRATVAGTSSFIVGVPRSTAAAK
jgi:uncharacterized protein with NRDE domain